MLSGAARRSVAALHPCIRQATQGRGGTGEELQLVEHGPKAVYSNDLHGEPQTRGARGASNGGNKLAGKAREDVPERAWEPGQSLGRYEAPTMQIQIYRREITRRLARMR